MQKKSYFTSGEIILFLFSQKTNLFKLWQRPTLNKLSQMRIIEDYFRKENFGNSSPFFCCQLHCLFSFSCYPHFTAFLFRQNRPCLLSPFSGNIEIIKLLACHGKE